MSSVQESGCYPQVNICSVKASALLPKTSPPSGISASSSWWTFDLFSQVSEGHWNSDMFMVPSQAHLSSVCQQPPPRTQHSWGTQLVRENEEEVQTPACAKSVGRGGGGVKSGLRTQTALQAEINPGRKYSESEFLLLSEWNPMGTGRLQAQWTELPGQC